MATKRQSYTTSEKLKIIKFAEEHGNQAAQREFGIAESNVRLWRKSKENLQKMLRLQRADRGRKAAWPRLEQDLMAWITEKRNYELAILPAMVRLKALEMSKDAKYEITAGQFKASNHWCQRFMKRNGLSLRQKKPSEELMCQWIGEAWCDIPREMVAKSFLKCGITNSMDEDDFVFDSSDDDSVVADDSLVTELFGDSDSESDFEGF